MKYLFFTLLLFSYGYVLPTLPTLLQFIATAVGLAVIAFGAWYYVATRVSAVR